ncbi:MAG TPA: hypothetical protein PKA55_04565 [Rhodoblastus sp.]|nr:hypothetical protein [Rhodoblastus sp.]
MRIAETLRNWIASIAAALSDHALWNHEPLPLDEATRAAYLDDIIYLALIMPHA